MFGNPPMCVERIWGFHKIGGPQNKPQNVTIIVVGGDFVKGTPNFRKPPHMSERFKFRDLGFRAKGAGPKPLKPYAWWYLQWE